MKTNKLTIATLAIALLFIACNGPEGETVETSDSVETSDAQVKTEYPVDSASVIGFTGYKPNASHTGNFTISEGSFIVNSNDKIEGNFVFDIGSLVITDGTEDDLRKHLLDEDFFDVAQYPQATFVITNVIESPHPGDSSTVSGNLELKGISKNITFPALIRKTDNSLQAQAAFLIDRTLWDLHYGNDASLGDKFIKPEVMINFDLTGHLKEM